MIARMVVPVAQRRGFRVRLRYGGTTSAHGGHYQGMVGMLWVVTTTSLEAAGLDAGGDASNVIVRLTM